MIGHHVCSDVITYSREGNFPIIISPPIDLGHQVLALTLLAFGAVAPNITVQNYPYNKLEHHYLDPTSFCLCSAQVRFYVCQSCKLKKTFLDCRLSDLSDY